MLKCFIRFKSCQRCGPVATYVTLKIRIYFKVLIARVFSFSFLVRWIVMGPYAGFDYLRKYMRAHTAPGKCIEHVWYGICITKYTDICKTCAYWLLWFIMCFFQCSRKAPKSQNSQACKFPFLMLVSHVLQKKLPNSEHFPHWRQLCHGEDEELERHGDLVRNIGPQVNGQGEPGPLFWQPCNQRLQAHKNIPGHCFDFELFLAQLLQPWLTPLHLIPRHIWNPFFLVGFLTREILTGKNWLGLFLNFFFKANFKLLYFLARILNLFDLAWHSLNSLG